MKRTDTTNCFSQIKGIGAAVLALFLLTPADSARASLIDVDFNTATSPTQSGQAVIGSAGDNWNAATTGAVGQALHYSSGSGSGVTMDVNAASVFDAPVDTPFFGSPVQPLMEDFLFNFSGTNTITLHGVAAGTYDLYVYSAGDHVDGTTSAQQRVSDFSANGVTGTVGPNAGAGTLTLGTNYTLLTTTVTGSGLLTISVSSGISGDTGQFNGFQLTQHTPEPASFILCGLGAIGLLLAARRRKA